MKNYITGSVLAFVLVLPVAPVSAETITATPAMDANTSMLTLMQSLIKQVELLQKQLSMLQAGMKEMPAREINNDDRPKSEEVKKKGEVLREKVRGELGAMSTSSTEKAIAAAHIKVSALEEAVETVTDTKVAKKTSSYLAQAEKKLTEAEERVIMGKYRDALAKALQANRLAERGLAEAAEVKDEADSTDDDTYERKYKDKDKKTEDADDDKSSNR